MVANVGLAASVIESLHYDHYEGHAGFATGHHNKYRASLSTMLKSCVIIELPLAGPAS